jgi:hypothetical protein
MNAFIRALIAGTVIMNATKASAEEGPWPGAQWHLRKTDQGCLYYDGAAWDAKKDAQIRKTWFFSIRWEGSPCTAGNLISGAGTLVEVQNLKITTGRPGKGINRYSGTMANGSWDGTMTHSDQYPGQSPHSYSPSQYKMGCNTNWINCTPPRAAVISK